MRKFFSIAALSAFTLLLAACGGDSFKGSGSSTGGTGGTGGSNPPAAVASLTVGTTAMAIPSDNSASAAIVAIAKDANSATVAGTTVTFSVSGGASITTTQGTTDSNGSAQATLTAGTAAPGSTVTVTATSGKVTGTINITISDARKTMLLLTSSPQVPSDNSAPATISAIVKDANNNLLAGVPVQFQVTSGAIVPVQTAAGKTASPAVVAGTTDANGLAQASVTTPGDPSNRAITVNATAGSATGTVTLSVSGSALSLTGPNNVVLGNTGTCTIVLTDSSGHGVGNQTVNVTSAKGNTLSAASVVTDANGHATFTVKGVNGGTDTITASSLGLTQAISVAVSTQSFNITAPADNTKVGLGTNQAVTVTWTNNNALVVGQPVTFSTTRGTVSQTTAINTDANGQATVNASSTSSGPAIIQATASGVTAQLNLDFVAQTPSQVSFQAQPTTVAVQGQSTLIAQVRDAHNNLVEGATVNFNITTDPTNGSLSAASAQTDAQGRAQVIYTAGNSSSGANGVSVTATVTGAPVATAQLTVGGQSLFLTFGTGATVDDTKGSAIYQVTYTVIATDSHGAGVPNVPISASVLPVAYGKGVWACHTGDTVMKLYASTDPADTFAYKSQPKCVNEDTDYTGNIASQDSGTPATCTNLLNNTTITSHQKDYNCSGTLEPGNAASVSQSALVTDATGRLDLVITYNRDHAYWLTVKLVASTTVQGTESTASTVIDLVGTTTDFGNKACNVVVPGMVSPYGIQTTCRNPN
jgi:hypothetical protein